MKKLYWVAAAIMIAPLFACTSTEDDPEGAAGSAAGTGGSGGAVVDSGAGGTGGPAGTGGGTGGTGATSTGGTGNAGGTAGTGGTGTPPNNCIVQFNIAECQSCFETNCSAACESYSTTTGAADHLNCVVGCQDDACISGCDAQYPDAAAPFADMFSCIDTNCNDQCNPTGGCILQFTDAECDACFNTNCSAECATYSAANGAVDHLNCMIDCEDDACADGCNAQYPDAAAPFDDILSCLDTSCASECSPSGNCILQLTDATCNACFETNCSAECQTYSEANGAVDHLNCVIDCEDDACVEACDTQYPDAAAPFEAIMTCVDTSCATECGM